MGLPEELKAKRGELSGRARASGVLADLQAQIAAVDKVIGIYKPERKASSRKSAAAFADGHERERTEPVHQRNEQATDGPRLLRTAKRPPAMAVQHARVRPWRGGGLGRPS